MREVRLRLPRGMVPGGAALLPDVRDSAETPAASAAPQNGNQGAGWACACDQSARTQRLLLAHVRAGPEGRWKGRTPRRRQVARGLRHKFRAGRRQGTGSA